MVLLPMKAGAERHGLPPRKNQHWTDAICDSRTGDTEPSVPAALLRGEGSAGKSIEHAGNSRASIH